MKRVIAVWLAIIAAETIHGTLRVLLLAPRIGDFRSRQASVFTGAAMILVIACLLSPWMRARTRRDQLVAGAVWVVFTVAFEFALGRFVLGASWNRILEDYRIWEGGLMPLGLAAMGLSPWLAAQWRQGWGLRKTDPEMMRPQPKHNG